MAYCLHMALPPQVWTRDEMCKVQKGQRGQSMRLALTGGATGIGAATVARLRADGHEIVIFDIQKPEGDEHWIKLDLMDEGSISAALEAADGSFDGLVSIAGIPPRGDNEVACLTINTLATCAFIEGFMPKLNEAAAVVTVASRAGMAWQSNLDQLDDLLAQTPPVLPIGALPTRWMPPRPISCRNRRSFTGIGAQRRISAGTVSSRSAVRRQHRNSRRFRQGLRPDGGCQPGACRTVGHAKRWQS